MKTNETGVDHSKASSISFVNWIRSKMISLKMNAVEITFQAQRRLFCCIRQLIRKYFLFLFNSRRELRLHATELSSIPSEASTQLFRLCKIISQGCKLHIFSVLFAWFECFPFAFPQWKISFVRTYKCSGMHSNGFSCVTNVGRIDFETVNQTAHLEQWKNRIELIIHSEQMNQRLEVEDTSRTLFLYLSHCLSLADFISMPLRLPHKTKQTNTTKSTPINLLWLLKVFVAKFFSFQLEMNHKRPMTATYQLFGRIWESTLEGLPFGRSDEILFVYK